jgi:hypothetical protein
MSLAETGHNSPLMIAFKTNMLQFDGTDDMMLAQLSASLRISDDDSLNIDDRELFLIRSAYTKYKVPT